MRTEDIRQRFLRHFSERGHTVVPSASLVADDPTLLLVNAGMVPFKPYFLGDVPAPYPRATSVQKVVRTNDIENVGRTTRHLSFFQMAGNFSFGDYFKERAIPLAWDLLTRPVGDGGYGFDPARMWATVYLDDDEAFRLWRQLLPAERIQRRGKEDNFWSMGVPGPCGPCSEIYFDRGPDHGRDGGPVADENRYLEVWNLVFMQFERGPGAGYDYPILRDLPSRNIDTGLGIERMAALLQGVDNVYETDLLRPVLDRACALTGRRYGADHEDDVRLRVVAEHTRTSVMLIGDGVVPANEGRGYVLRRMLRRVIRCVRLLGLEEPVMPDLVPVVIGLMRESYPEIGRDAERIARYAQAEEESFLSTLRAGSAVFDTAVGELRARGSRTLPGDQAFRLHDTYGFPIDLTLEMAAEQGLSVDEQEFTRLMAAQRAAAKADRAGRGIGNQDLSLYRPVLARAGASRFTGYTEVVRESTVRGLLTTAGEVATAGAGEEVDVVLDVTPFYAEGGGQQPDTGVLVFDGGQLEVLDVQRPVADLIVHRARVVSGELRDGATVEARVDVSRRRAISRAHTATHLVHRAFRGALGEAATQAGSLNAPGRLRFDFASPSAVPAGVLADVEDEVNAVLVDDLEVRAFVTSQEEARRIGAMALFGEKYGDRVRVVEVGEYARELCGGTHVARSAQIGMVKLLSEASIGAGVRRVEALVGLDAFRFLAREHVLVNQLAGLLRRRPEEVVGEVEATLGRLRDAEKELERLHSEAALSGAGELASAARDVSGVLFVAAEAPEGTAAGDVRKLATEVRGRLAAGRPGVVAVAGRSGGKVSLVVLTNDEARARGLSARDLLAVGAPLVGGRGGGNDEQAQGGGGDPTGIAAALGAVERRIGGADRDGAGSTAGGG